MSSLVNGKPFSLYSVLKSSSPKGACHKRGSLTHRTIVNIKCTFDKDKESVTTNCRLTRQATIGEQSADSRWTVGSKTYSRQVVLIGVTFLSLYYVAQSPYHVWSLSTPRPWPLSSGAFVWIVPLNVKIQSSVTAKLPCLWRHRGHTIASVLSRHAHCKPETSRLSAVFSCLLWRSWSGRDCRWAAIFPQQRRGCWSCWSCGGTDKSLASSGLGRCKSSTNLCTGTVSNPGMRNLTNNDWPLARRRTNLCHLMPGIAWSLVACQCVKERTNGISVMWYTVTFKLKKNGKLKMGKFGWIGWVNV